MVLIRSVGSALLAPVAGALALGLGVADARAQEPAAPALAPRATTAAPRAYTAPAPPRATTPAPAAPRFPAPAPAWAGEDTEEAPGAAIAGARQQRRTAWLGIGLSCSRCSFHTEGKSLSAWVFNEPPVLYQVDPNSPADRGGLRTGDTLLSINGQALTTVRGGRAFANMIPGVAVRLGYRRDGRERTTRVVPEEPPARDAEAAEEELLAQTARAQQDAARTLTRTYQRDAERAQQELARAQQELARDRDKELTERSRELVRRYLEQAQRALENTQSPLLTLPSPPAAVAPAPPAGAPAPDAAPAVPAGPPEAAVAPETPTPRGLGWAVAPPGRLRYSGRLGSTVIEARRPGGVNVIETGDSQVVLTGGDLSVRLTLVPGSALRTRVVSNVGGWSVARSTQGAIARGLRGYLVNPRLGRSLGSTTGVLVLDVADGSQADSLGIVPGDVLVQLNHDPVVSILPDDAPAGRTLRRPVSQPATTSAVVVRQHARRILQLPAAVRRAPVPPAVRRPQVPAVPPERRP